MWGINTLPFRGEIKELGVEVFGMKAQIPFSKLSLEDGFIALGRKIYIEDPKTVSKISDTMLGVAKMRQPEDNVVAHCRTASTKDGELTVCEVSLLRNHQSNPS